jgi:hypothetical protein
MQPWGVLPSLGSPAAFPSPWIKASGFASHPFEWFAFSSFLYPQTCPVKFFAEDERSGFNWGYAD